MSRTLAGITLLAVGLLGLLLVRRSPRSALVVWLTVVCAVPVWVVLPVRIDLEPEVLVSLLLLACLLPLGRGPGRAAGRLAVADGLVALFFLAALLPVGWGAATVADDWVLVMQWGAAFLVGRLIGQRVQLPWVYAAVAVAFTVVAGFALAEYLTGWNPFALLPGSGPLHDAWAPVQMRAGRPRAEGAFGHSIALGSSLAMAVPLALAAPFRPVVRVLMAVLMLAAIVVTFSRDGLATAVLGVALTVVFLRRGLSGKARLWVTGGLVVAAVATASWLSGVFAAAGSEATDSASYRLDLLTLIPRMAPLGLSDSVYLSPTGGRFFGEFRSIDNALLLLGLTYGWIPLVLVGLVLALVLGTVLAGQGTAPAIAIAAQVPALVTVALITQYASVVWFIAGLAVCAQAAERDRRAVGDGWATDRTAPRNGPCHSPGMVSPDLVNAPADLRS